MNKYSNAGMLIQTLTLLMSTLQKLLSDIQKAVGRITGQRVSFEWSPHNEATYVTLCKDPGEGILVNDQQSSVNTSRR